MHIHSVPLVLGLVLLSGGLWILRNPGFEADQYLSQGSPDFIRWQTGLFRGGNLAPKDEAYWVRRSLTMNARLLGILLMIFSAGALFVAFAADAPKSAH
jgi:hypothetical protein